MTRQVDDPVAGVEVGDIVNRPSRVTPDSLCSAPVEQLDGDHEQWNAMRLSGTYLEGDFVQTLADKDRYFAPQGVTKSERYVNVTDLRTELSLAMTEDRFTKLVEAGVIVPTE